MRSSWEVVPRERRSSVACLVFSLLLSYCVFLSLRFFWFIYAFPSVCLPIYVSVFCLSVCISLSVSSSVCLSIFVFLVGVIIYRTACLLECLCVPSYTWILLFRVIISKPVLCVFLFLGAKRNKRCRKEIFKYKDHTGTGNKTVLIKGTIKKEYRYKNKNWKCIIPDQRTWSIKHCWGGIFKEGSYGNGARESAACQNVICKYVLVCLCISVWLLLFVPLCVYVSTLCLSAFKCSYLQTFISISL